MRAVGSFARVKKSAEGTFLPRSLTAGFFMS